MAQQLTYDVVVLGAGAVGENAADRAGRTGLSVVIVESELVGGECSYWACMPSKALLRPGAALAAVRDVPGAAAAVTGDLDVAAVLARRTAFTHDWDDASQVRWLERTGIDLVRGHARLTGPRSVEVDTEDGTLALAARDAVIVATGSEAVVPEVPGLATSRPWTSREATAAEEVPTSLAIIGGGVVGVEMATAYTDLGCAVTLVVRGDRVLSGAEPFAGEAVGEALRELGVDLRLSTGVTSVARDDDGVVLTLEPGGTVRADEVLVATGRRPRTGDLGLEAVGLTPGRPLAVDDHLEVLGVPGGWLYAAGDVTGRTATTHQGKYDARVAGDVVAGRFGPDEDARPDEGARFSRWRADADPVATTQVVFTRPEVAWVGRTESQARADGLAVRCVDVDLGAAAGASVLGDSVSGQVRLVLDEHRQVIVGATFVGPEIAEMLHAATIAVVAEVPLARLWHAVPAYPTVSEVWLRLLEDAGL